MKNEAKHIRPDEKTPRDVQHSTQGRNQLLKFHQEEHKVFFFLFHYFLPSSSCSTGEFTSTIYRIRLLPNGDIMLIKESASPLSCSYSGDEQSTASLLTAQKVV